VLDDLHALIGHESAELLEAIVLGLISARVKVALGSRAEPVKLIIRLRLLGRVTVVDADHLALSHDEIEQLFAEGQAPAEVGLVDSVYRQTQGWPAAVRFALLAARSGHGNDQALPSAALDPALATYLTHEVFNLLPGAATEVLRGTVVVDEISPDLALAMTGRTDAGRVLDDLFRSQYLVRRIAGEQPWYVVHVLLRNQLLADLAADDATAVQRQNAAAAKWFADNALPEPALRHARASGDPALVEELVAAYGMRLVTTGAADVVVESLEAMSPDRWDEHLLGLVTLARAECGDVVGARRLLSQRGPGPTAPIGDAGPSTLQTAEFCVRRLEGRIHEPGSGVFAWTPTEQPNEGHLDRDLLVLLNRGQWQFAIGRYEQSFADLRTALDMATTHRRDRIALRCMASLAATHAIVGESAAQARYVQEVLALIEARGWATVPAVSNIYTAGAWAAYNLMLPAEAELMIAQAHAALRGSADPEYATYAALMDAALHVDRQCDAVGALRVLEGFAHGGTGSRLTPILRGFAAVQRVRIHIRRREFAGALQAVSLVRSTMPEAGDATLCKALVEGARGRWNRVGDLLKEIDDLGLKFNVRANEVTRLLLGSVVAVQTGRQVAARESLLEALAVAGDRGVLRPFFDVGPAVHEMLITHRGRLGSHDELAGTILTRWPDLADLGHDGEALVRGPGQVPNLTPKEAEVLRELPTLMTVEEIAAAHLVSVNTIRTHMRGLYRKLGVHTRRDAVRRGRELGLLP
jgi:LuxR family maltose regulon positive regulatory protein